MAFFKTAGCFAAIAFDVLDGSVVFIAAENRILKPFVNKKSERLFIFFNLEVKKILRCIIFYMMIDYSRMLLLNYSFLILLLSL